MNNNSGEPLEIGKPIAKRYLPDGTAENILPPHLNAYAKGHLHLATVLARKALAYELVRAMSLTIRVDEYPVAVSDQIEPGKFSLVNERIVVNEDWAKLRGIDSDGDRAYIHWLPDRSAAIFIKLPITRRVPILIYQECPEKVLFKPLDPAFLWANQEYDLATEFGKSHAKNLTGAITIAWNSRELLLGTGKSFEERLNLLCSDPQRYEDIETGGLKAANKDGLKKTIPKVLRKGYKAAKKTIQLLLLSPGSIDNTPSEALRWLDKTNLDDLVDKIQNLKIGKNDFFTTLKKVSPNRLDTPVAKPHEIKDGEFLYRLAQAGVLKTKHLPPIAETKEGKPIDTVVLWAVDPETGAPAAFLETKRNQEIGYITYLYPVYDPLRGEIIPPIQFLAEELAKQDFARIINPTTDEHVRFWPKDRIDFKSHPYKITMLQRFLTKHIGAWGDVAPCILHPDDTYRPTPQSVEIAKNTVAVDYREIPPSQWLEAAKRCPLPLALAGGKTGASSQNYARKYVLAREDGLPLYAPPGVHPRRSANQRSQLLRSTEPIPMRILITDIGMTEQVLITPSGIKKQQNIKCFMPRISTEPDERFPYPTTIKTWSGKEQMVWTQMPREAIKIGKLIDTTGLKFMPMPHPQLHLNTGEEVDLIIPWQFIADKGAQAAFRDGVPAEFTVDGETHIGITMIYNFHRTGVASENITPQKGRILKLKGFDRFPVYYAFLRSLKGKENNLKKLMDTPSPNNTLLEEINVQKYTVNRLKRIKLGADLSEAKEIQQFIAKVKLEIRRGKTQGKIKGEIPTGNENETE